MVVIPLNLPSIVKAKPYSKNEFGGYLLNDVEDFYSLIGEKLGYGKSSEIKNNIIIY